MRDMQPFLKTMAILHMDIYYVTGKSSEMFGFITGVMGRRSDPGWIRRMGHPLRILMNLWSKNSFRLSSLPMRSHLRGPGLKMAHLSR